MKTALSIAGSDSCGGAGIQADIKTMTMNGVYAMTAITALTAQNTTGVRAIQEATPAFLKEQLDAVFEDIFPDAVKIGMVSSSDLIRVIAERLRHYGAKNIVVDPVMVATSGSSLMKTDAVHSPPLTRGIPLVHVDTVRRHRFTPAHAGNTESLRSQWLLLQVHPRSRGEYSACLTSCHAFIGSPPLTLGIQTGENFEYTSSRFTPAHAGNTRLFFLKSCLPEVHPRSRGEYHLSILGFLVP